MFSLCIAFPFHGISNLIIYSLFTFPMEWALGFVRLEMLLDSCRLEMPCTNSPLGSLWGPPRHSHIHPLLRRCFGLRNPNSNSFDGWLLQVFLAGECIDLQKRTPFCWTFFNHCDYFYLLPELKLKRAISNIMWKPRRIPSEISVNVQTYRAW